MVSGVSIVVLIPMLVGATAICIYQYRSWDILIFPFKKRYMLVKRLWFSMGDFTKNQSSNDLELLYFSVELNPCSYTTRNSEINMYL